MLYTLNMGGVDFLPIHRLLFDITTYMYLFCTCERGVRFSSKGGCDGD